MITFQTFIIMNHHSIKCRLTRCAIQGLSVNMLPVYQAPGTSESPFPRPLPPLHCVLLQQQRPPGEVQLLRGKCGSKHHRRYLGVSYKNIRYK